MLQRRALLAAASVLALASLCWLDGWYGAPSARGSTLPTAASTALGDVAADLARRARVLASNDEVGRSLEGGGIALQRQALFGAARDAMVGAAPGSWITLADPDGNVLAWWGETPARMPTAPRSGSLSVRWSSTQMELAFWKTAGSGVFSGTICAARSFPVEAPAFAEAVGLEADARDWEPVAPGDGHPVLLADGAQALVSARRADPPIAPVPAPRTAALALVLVAILPLLAAGPWWVGAGLALAFLASVAAASGAAHALAEPRLWILALGPLM
ncbi:MAG TPA: hypothetical protein VGG65_04005, partial [Thermoanaerobaculia bacterium]